MKKVIAFSLWGTSPKYTVGAVQNARLCARIYPGWQSRFYCGTTVPKQSISKLRAAGAEIVEMNEAGDWSGMFWRFLTCEDADIVLSRDCDSRPSQREKHAVEEWLHSNRDFHIMRDHPYHGVRILGGMWGCRNGILRNIRELVQAFVAKLRSADYWQVDQQFLGAVVYPRVCHTAWIHDSYRFFKDEDFHPFPTKRFRRGFVGEIFDGRSRREPTHYLLL